MKVIKQIATRVLRFSIDVFHVVLYPLGGVSRAAILWTASRVLIKSILSSRIRLSSEHLFGYSVRVLSYVEFALIFREMFIRKAYNFHSEVDDPLILDVGGNIGLATLFFKWRYPKAKVVVFEPSSAAFSLLEENVRENGLTDVELVQAAVSGESGETTLRIPRRTDGSNKNLLATTSALYNGADQLDGTSMSEERVRSVVLSEYIAKDRTTLVKIDVEGAEGDVVRELAESGLLGVVSELAIEYHYDTCDMSLAELLGVLETHGLTTIVHGDNMRVPMKQQMKRAGLTAMIHACRMIKSPSQLDSE